MLESNRLRNTIMRRQVTVYLKSAQMDWLADYASELGLDRSEVVRLLVEREREVGWLRWSRSVPDPDMGKPKPLRPSKRKLQPN